MKVIKVNDKLTINYKDIKHEINGQQEYKYKNRNRKEFQLI